MAKTKKNSESKKPTKYKKAPDAPKRFKSAFIIFSAEKHKEIKKKLLEEGKAVRTTGIAKLVSEAWKSLDPEERKEWEAKADKDKIRYEAEKALYKGPWKIPSNKRKTKDPSAPKRPMSAFLAYSNSRRAELKRQHPKSTNADLSRMLSKSWKELNPQDRAVYMAEEREKREQYKTDMSEWRKKVASEKKVEREEREVAALKAAEAGAQHGGMEHGLPHGMENNSKWMVQNGMQQSDDLQHQFQQQQQQQQQQSQMNDMASAQGNMFSNPYLQSFGGGGQMDPRAAALGINPATNPYLANPFAAGQGYMQGLFGAQSYMPNAGMTGQIYGGGNFGGMNMNGMNDGGGGSGGNGTASGRTHYSGQVPH